MEFVLHVAFWLQVLRITVPYALAALGGTYSERAGVVNLSLEGTLLVGAFAAALSAERGGVGLGLLGGALGGLATAGLYGLVVLKLRADQIVSGVAINLLALGLTRFLLKLVWGSASSSPQLPGFGVGASAELFMAAVGLAVLVAQVVMMRTAFGLRVRAVGEHPEAADSLGVEVLRVRWAAVLVAGVLAGLGGAWLALDNHGFVDRMSGGRGYIALAAMIFGRWRPAGAAAACLLFGFADALQLNLQGTTSAIPRELIQILPYAITLVALCTGLRGARAPAALGKPWFGR